MLHGIYLRKNPSGKFFKETTTISYFLERIAIDFQFSREGNYILNLQGGSLLGVFVPTSSRISDVVLAVQDDYGFTIELE
jgi:hypothetical protein